MRITLALAIDVGITMIGVALVVGLLSRRSRLQIGSVSEQWVAEHSRLDSDLP
jgi:hypothetical protein